MLHQYKLISFDAGGTLFRPYPSVGAIYKEVAAEYGCHAEEDAIEQRFKELWAHKDSMHSHDSHLNEKVEKLWWKHLVSEVFSVFDPIDDFDEFFDVLYERFAGPSSWRLFPETIEVLDTLKKRDMKLCIISNWDSRLLKLCEGLGIHQYFDFILISAVFGTSKPNAPIFEEACRRGSVAPHEVIHIGDSLEDDVHGASKSGIAPVLIDRHERTSEQPADYHRISCLTQLL